MVPAVFTAGPMTTIATGLVAVPFVWFANQAIQDALDQLSKLLLVITTFLLLVTVLFWTFNHYTSSHVVYFLVILWSSAAMWLAKANICSLIDYCLPPKKKVDPVSNLVADTMETAAAVCERISDNSGVVGTMVATAGNNLGFSKNVKGTSYKSRWPDDKCFCCGDVLYWVWGGIPVFGSHRCRGRDCYKSMCYKCTNILNPGWDRSTVETLRCNTCQPATPTASAEPAAPVAVAEQLAAPVTVAEQPAAPVAPAEPAAPVAVAEHDAPDDHGPAAPAASDLFDADWENVEWDAPTAHGSAAAAASDLFDTDWEVIYDPQAYRLKY